MRSDFRTRISGSGFSLLLMTSATILIVEDDDFQYEIYEETLADYELVRARNGSEALDQIPRHPPNLLILDHMQGPRRAHYCLPKPVDVHELRRTVDTALKECGETEAVRQFEALERARRVDAQELFSRSTDRLNRQNHLREMVRQSTERPNISALARQFGVARRTIIRDLQELIRRGQLPPEIYPEWEDPLDET
jgi:hypothetical protein